ncbi:GntR family transcriptional regulator [Streptomyces canus]|jgi:DNA-binding transcriptional regulator YhcF (GntR family)|uniref:GntR family transcriptional regulator n=1 Tax=Streptomyces canus TaxID=58343 RepID=UPI003722CC16
MELYRFVVSEVDAAVNGSARLSSQEIADTLRERIRVGDLRAGQRLPTQARLAEEFGVERGAVRQALRVLQEEGRLSNVSKGSPPLVAEPAPQRGEPQPTMVALAPRLTEAFAAPQVRIDAVCLTAENLQLAVGEPIRLVHEGRLRPRAIDVRILLPSRKIDLAFPAPVESSDDGNPVHRHWLAKRNAQSLVLRHNLQELRTAYNVEVSVSFRALPFTPPVKLYLLNGTEALMAYYVLVEREERYDNETVEMYDAVGSQSLLFSFEKAVGPQEAAFVDESQKWFDALWETIATALTLT